MDDVESERMPRSQRTEPDQPFAWWGPAWVRPNPMTLADLVAAGSVSLDVAASLQLLMEHRTSVAVLAGPSGAGKTTFLSALLDELPNDTTRIYLRGGYETFDFLRDAGMRPRETVVLANEISPHLPVYLWGPAVARFLGLREQGFSIAATAHATTIDAFVALLTGYPLRIGDTALAAFEVVVILAAYRESSGAIVRKVDSVWCLSAGPQGGLQVELLTEPDSDGRGINHEVLQRSLERRGSYLALHTLVTYLQYRRVTLGTDMEASPFGEQPHRQSDR